MIAGSTLGYSRTPRYVYPMAPKRRMTREMTMVRTGLLMQTAERLTRALPCARPIRMPRSLVHRLREQDGRAGADLEKPGGDHGVAFDKPAEDLHFLFV